MHDTCIECRSVESPYYYTTPAPGSLLSRIYSAAVLSVSVSLPLPLETPCMREREEQEHPARGIGCRDSRYMPVSIYTGIGLQKFVCQCGCVWRPLPPRSDPKGKEECHHPPAPAHGLMWATAIAAVPSRTTTPQSTNLWALACDGGRRQPAAC